MAVAVAVNSDDGNDTINTATVLPSFSDPNVSIIVHADEVGGSDPADFLSFTASSSGVIKFDLQELNDDLDLYLLDSAGVVLQSSNNFGPVDERIIYFLEENQTYFIEITPWETALSDYTLTVYQVLEATISTQHGANGELVFTVDAGLGAQVIKDPSGNPIAVSSAGDWQIITARWDGEFYSLILEHPVEGYSAWDLDASGTVTYMEQADNIADYELYINLDLNGDGAIGYNLAVVEDDGEVGLSLATDGYYYIETIPEPIQIIADTSYPLWAAEVDGGGRLLHVEQSDTGYRLFGITSSGDYAEAETDAEGNVLSGSLAAVDNVVDLEEFYQADLNGDGAIGDQIIIIETNGSYGLFSSSAAGAYYIGDMSSDASVAVTQNGELVGPDTLAGWDMVQAARNITDDGYTVLWEEASGLRAVWDLDETGAVTGGSLVENVVDYEELFEADLNGDGEIGHLFDTIETIGSYGLFSSSTAGAYYVAHMSSPANVAVTQNGELVGPDTLPGWQMVQAARNITDDGYTVLWEEESGLRAVWELDETGAVTGGSLVDNVVDYEELFDEDLNGDGEIGHQVTTIEEYGAIALRSSTAGAYSVYDMFNDIAVTVTQNGEVVGPDTLAGWQMVQAERNTTDDGYTVLWEEESGLRAVWELDETGAVTGGSLVDNVVDYEVQFEADLNNDDEIGHQFTYIEENGNFALFSSTAGEYYVHDIANDSSVTVTQNGEAVGPDTLEGWAIVQAERNTTDDGYTVFWEEESGLRAVWDLDENGAVTGGSLVDNVVDYEAQFSVDLNGDEFVGHRFTDIETVGSHGLFSSTYNAYYVADMSSDGFVTVTQNGVAVGPDTLEGWAMVQAARNETDDGYTVFWEEESGLRAVWDLDENGAVTGGSLVDNVVDYEAQFGVDLNGDEFVGHLFTEIETVGSHGLFSSTYNAYYVADMSSDAFVTVTQNGVAVGPDTLEGWAMVQAARNTTDDGYTVFWEEDSGLRAVWDLDENGAVTGGALVDNVVDYEAQFGVDLNGDELIGTDQFIF